MHLRRRENGPIRRAERGVGGDGFLVLDAAAALDIREYDLFDLAWRQWRGNAPNAAALERVFVAYMFHREIPAWVRHFARTVLRCRDDGRLDRASFGADRVRRRERPVPLGRLYVGIVAALTLLFVLVLTNTPNDDFTGPTLGCTGGGMTFVAQVARQFTGKDDPFACRR